MTDSNVTRVFSPDEALAFVIERGVITMPVAELAAAWGWPHCTQVYRALDRWVRDGLIERQGKVIRARAKESNSTLGGCETTMASRLIDTADCYQTWSTSLAIASTPRPALMPLRLGLNDSLALQNGVLFQIVGFPR